MAGWPTPGAASVFCLPHIRMDHADGGFRVGDELSGAVADRLGVAIGEAVCGPAATSWIGDLFHATGCASDGCVHAGRTFGECVQLSHQRSDYAGWGWRIALSSAALPAILLLLCSRARWSLSEGGGEPSEPWCISLATSAHSCSVVDHCLWRDREFHPLCAIGLPGCFSDAVSRALRAQAGAELD